MNISIGMIGKTIFSTVLSLLIVACDGSSSRGTAPNSPDQPATDPPAEPGFTYRADIVWTEYGIPHISAQDWSGLGYGTGYAYAQENYCQAMRLVVREAGESGRYLDGSVFADLINRAIRFPDDQIQRLYFEQASAPVAAMRDGYAAGMNRYLRETGVDQLAEGDFGCRGAQWVREVDGMDIARMMHELAWWNNPLPGFLTGSILRAIPSASIANRTDSHESIRRFDKAQYIASIARPNPGSVGSNAYAVGGDASQNGAGVLLANPHLLWADHDYFMAHQTMGEEYDVMGVVTSGNPFIHSGFNRDVAWAHTYSHGSSHFMLYELELNPQDPMQYIFDGEIRDIVTRTVSAEHVNAQGDLSSVEKTFYFSHLGPILDPGGALGGWPTPMGTVLTVYLPMQENNRRPDELLRMGKAQDTNQFKEAIHSVGITGAYTLATDRYGDAFFGLVAATPNISVEQYGTCVRGTLAAALTEAGYPTLDGSDPDCFMGSDPDTADNLQGFDRLPTLDTREYAANANQGFAIVNPRVVLEGYPGYMGERYDIRDDLGGQLRIRARQLFLQAEQRLAGTDGLGIPGFSVATMQELLFGSRSIIAEHIADDLVDICQAVEDWSPYTVNVQAAELACEVLADWDQRFLTDSVGAHLLVEFYFHWVTDTPSAGLYAVPLDPADPFNTPARLRREPEWVEHIRLAFARVVDVYGAHDIALDAAWGEVNYVERGGERFPLGGGPTFMTLSTILQGLYPGWGVEEPGEIIGNTYVSVVSWDETDCPDAYAVLTYSQSTDPKSAHYSDQTRLYSEAGWIDMPFCQPAIEAQELRRETVQE